MQAIKNFAYQEQSMENSRQNLKKMELIRVQLGYQYSAMAEATEKLEYINEQVNAMER